MPDFSSLIRWPSSSATRSGPGSHNKEKSDPGYLQAEKAFGDDDEEDIAGAEEESALGMRSSFFTEGLVSLSSQSDDEDEEWGLGTAAEAATNDSEAAADLISSSLLRLVRGRTDSSHRRCPSKERNNS